MKILIVANNPQNIGGVMNYTRPLASMFAELGHNVFYLYSGTWDSRYNFFFLPYIKEHDNHFNFKCVEIINSVNLSYNYGNPEIDVHSPAMEKLIRKYLIKIKPDVMHVHSRVGLPASINKIAYDLGIRVINTIHTYGYICQKRVMIDFNGENCAGPADFMKCAACTRTVNYNRARVFALLRNTETFFKNNNKNIYNILQSAKKVIRKNTDSSIRVESEIQPGNNAQLPLLAEQLKQRLTSSVLYLNKYSHYILCVSNDVRETLIKYGIEPEKLIVQHIGSNIAEHQTYNERSPQDQIVIGNIGGVHYYKGQHILMEALTRLKNTNFRVKIFGKYDERYIQSISQNIGNIPVEFTGRYKPEDLPKILSQIDIMVLPSICNDTAPQTIFESFSGGVPIIASDIGGFPDFVIDGVNGSLFRAGDSADLAKKIDMVLEKPEVVLRYRQRIPKLKTIQENALELLDLYHMHESIEQFAERCQ